MAIFPFIQVASKMLQVRFGFNETEAGQLFGIPYTISAATSPFLGILIDRIGRRGLMIILSSVVLLAAHVTNMFLSTCNPGDHCYSEVGPLVMVGIGYSIYAAALWGSIPYVVQARTVGTAFGFCTAIQNAGMAIAPTIVGAIIDATDTDYSKGYFWPSVFWACICLVGIALNIWLYFEDINNNGGQLNKVHRGDGLQQLMTSPEGGERRRLEIENDENMAPESKEYLLKDSARAALKRSMVRKSMAK
jgi:MFS family permease